MIISFTTAYGGGKKEGISIILRHNPASSRCLIGQPSKHLTALYTILQ
ncbi:MAG: hypothetical protein LBR79_06515 [Oscillospiraceae bacterium]|nr:hypothetical protein [Oscillospiraceae bacterium]